MYKVVYNVKNKGIKAIRQIKGVSGGNCIQIQVSLPALHSYSLV
jgi:hypothetical protein